ncbi:MAG: OmpA family protein, partial [Chitinophagaceae bacterium]
IYLEPIERKKAITFKNVLFETNAYQLKDSTIVELDKLAQLLTENPSVQIEIIGHTDNTGDTNANLILSTKRAKSITDYLIKKGIDAKRLRYKGLGASSPIADNTTEAGKATNRRTEFIIIEM